MRSAEVTAVGELADAIHPSLPEDPAVFANRLALYPQGSLVLAASDVLPASRDIFGYAVAHPWRGDIPPKLDTVLDGLPEKPDRFYIHDLAISPACRGGGHATEAVARLMKLAEAFPAAILVSVYGTVPFWSRFGFRETMATFPPGAMDAYGAEACLMIRTARK